MENPDFSKDFEQFFKQVIEKSIKQEIQPQDKLKDFGIDSLDIAEICYNIETNNEFGVDGVKVLDYCVEHPNLTFGELLEFAKTNSLFYKQHLQTVLAGMGRRNLKPNEKLELTTFDAMLIGHYFERNTKLTPDDVNKIEAYCSNNPDLTFGSLLNFLVKKKYKVTEREGIPWHL